MATHSSVLAWRIPGTAEPGGLPSMGSHRVRHDWSDLAVAAATPVWLQTPSRCSASVEEQLVKHCSKYLLENQIQLSMGCRGFAGGSEGKESACNAGYPGLIPGSERSPGEGHRNRLQYSCLENSMDKGASRLQFIGSQRVRDDWNDLAHSTYNTVRQPVSLCDWLLSLSIMVSKRPSWCNRYQWFHFFLKKQTNKLFFNR